MLKSGYYFYFRKDNIEWFKSETIKIENKTKFSFDNTNNPLKISEEDEKIFGKQLNGNYIQKLPN